MTRPLSRRQLIKATAATAAASVLVGVGAGTAAAYTAPTARQQIDLTSGWKFLRSDVAGAETVGFNDSAWSSVSVPHTWNALDGQDGGNNYYRGVGWYRLHVTPPAGLAGKKLWLQFDGADTVADVYLNGVHLGQHVGGYARFRFDASALKVGADNVIAVKVTNAYNADVPPLSADYTFFGGLYRKVSLLATDALQIRTMDDAGPGVYVRQRAVSTTSATVDVTTKGWNNSGSTRNVAVRTVITDATGAVVADTTSAVGAVATASGFQTVQTVTIANPRLWRGKDDPHVHAVTVEVHDTASGAVTDAVTEPLGLRGFSVDANAGFFLNGSHLSLHGVNRHQDRLNLGWAIGAAEHTQDFDLMDEMGVNALRTAHYQQAQEVYDLADQRGYVVWVEIPLVNSITQSAAFTANARQLLRELIKQNYNHPSICFWGIGNEQRTDDSATNALLATLASDVTSLDPDRLSTYAQINGTVTGLINHTQVNGFNPYYGWYYGSYNDFAPWADSMHANQPTRRFCVSEYGAGASIHQHQENPPQPVAGSTWHPEEYQSKLHEVHWTAIRTRPYLWGTFVWNMFDFAVDARNEGDTPGRNDKGLVTYDRATRKDAFFWYKANWTNTPFVYITSRRWTSRTAAATTIKVYGNVDSVTLRLNGVQVGGPQTSTNHIYTWPVTLATGNNLVEVTGTRSGQTFTDSVTWTLQ